MQERRTNPSFLSDGEAARESRRLGQMVEGFLRWNPLVRVGETDNFAVDYDKRERLVFVYGKESPKGPKKFEQKFFTQKDRAEIKDLCPKSSEAPWRARLNCSS